MKRSLVYLLFGRKQVVRKEVWDDSLELFPLIFSRGKYKIHPQSFVYFDL